MIPRISSLRPLAIPAVALSLTALATVTSLAEQTLAVAVQQPGTSATTRSAATPFDRETIAATMRLVADRQLLRNRLQGIPDPGWVRAALYPGILATADVTGDEKYVREAVRWARDEGGWKIPGGPSTRPAVGRRFADNQAIGWTYAELSRRLGEPAHRADVERMFNEILEGEVAGRIDWWWADALFMAPPMLARMATVTGDPKYLQLMDRLFWDTVDFLYDPEERLIFRDKDFFKTRVGGKKLFWSRGNGWTIAGIIRVIRDLPKDHPSREKYITLFREMSDRIAGLQQPDGLWRSNLLVATHYPNPETSGTSFFVFALAAGINEGILDRAKYEPVVRRGWLGLNNCVLADGTLGYVQPIGGDPRPASPTSTHEYAVGAFLLAAKEVSEMGPPAPRTDAPPAPLPPYVAPTTKPAS